VSVDIVNPPRFRVHTPNSTVGTTYGANGKILNLKISQYSKTFYGWNIFYDYEREFAAIDKDYTGWSLIGEALFTIVIDVKVEIIKK
jgi:hypothetical protein